jgi:hypothetical protein
MRHWHYRFLDGLGWPKFWRIAGLLPAGVYFVWAYQSAYQGDRLGTGLFSLICALYLFGVGKAHSTVKRHGNKRHDR